MKSVLKVRDALDFCLGRHTIFIKMDEMQDAQKTVQAFIKRYRFLIIVIAALVLLGGAYVVNGVLDGKFRRVAESAVTSLVVPESVDGLVPRKLDGVSVLPSQADLGILAVMVENAPDARPLSGPSKASVALELPVEGGVTRFLLFFDASTTAEQIGPVRSARTYFVDFADGLKAVFAHVGGSPAALRQIQNLKGFKNLDEFSSGKYFWRSAKRPMPHNAYTRIDLLNEAVLAKAWTKEDFHPWRFASSSERGDVMSASIPYGGVFDVLWQYDPEADFYTRWQAGAVQKDSSGEEVHAANVIVMLSDEKVLDEVGRLAIRTTGSGKAVLYRNGKKIDMLWRRDEGEWLSFETVEGNYVEFQPGPAWISVVTEKSMLEGKK
ncbi:MAG: DUF3048 domain-containing protein [Patescibacteria group bacterium]